MSELTIIGSLIIVSAVVSVTLSILKARYGSLKSNKTKLVLVAISIALGGLYHLLVATGMWQTAYMILVTSSTVYAFFLKGK